LREYNIALPAESNLDFILREIPESIFLKPFEKQFMESEDKPDRSRKGRGRARQGVPPPLASCCPSCSSCHAWNVLECHEMSA
jgi:hypothetical protein